MVSRGEKAGYVIQSLSELHSCFGEQKALPSTHSSAAIVRREV